MEALQASALPLGYATIKTGIIDNRLFIGQQQFLYCKVLAVQSTMRKIRYTQAD